MTKTKLELIKLRYVKDNKYNLTDAQIIAIYNRMMNERKLELLRRGV